MGILREVKKTMVLLHLLVTEKYYLIFGTISIHNMFHLVFDYKMNPHPQI